MQRREMQQPSTEPLVPEVFCVNCHGTILPPTRGGVPRGRCHCPENRAAKRMTDWSAAPLTIRRND